MLRKVGFRIQARLVSLWRSAIPPRRVSSQPLKKPACGAFQMVNGVLRSALFFPLPSAIRFLPAFCLLTPVFLGAVEDEGAEGAEGFEPEALIEAKSARVGVGDGQGNPLVACPGEVVERRFQ